MGNDNKLDIILDELKVIKDNVTELKTDVAELKTDVSRLDNKIDAVEAGLTSKMNRGFKALEAKLNLSSTTLDMELSDMKKEIKELRNEMRAVVQY